MLNVTFLRHAKSNLSSYDGDDFTRDISEIGKQKTKKVGRFLKKEKIVFDEILCSPALRTKRTLDIISVFFLNKPKIKYIEELYHNSRKNLFEVLMLYAQKKKCLVNVGYFFFFGDTSPVPVVSALMKRSRIFSEYRLCAFIFSLFMTCSSLVAT